MKTVIKLFAFSCAALIAGCSGSGDAAVTPSNEKQVRDGISDSLTKLASNLPGSVYLSQRGPLDKVDHSLGPLWPDVKCKTGELRYTIAYWLKGANVSEEQKYADLIVGVWANKFGWAQDTSEPNPTAHTYTAPGGYRYTVAVDDSLPYRNRTAPAVWVHAESPCMAKDVLTGDWMPETIGSPKS